MGNNYVALSFYPSCYTINYLGTTGNNRSNQWLRNFILLNASFVEKNSKATIDNLVSVVKTMHGNIKRKKPVRRNDILSLPKLPQEGVHYKWLPNQEDNYQSTSCQMPV